MRIYAGLYIFSPFLAIFLKSLTKRQYQRFLAVNLLFFSCWKMIIPFARTWNSEGGFGLFWFFVLFAIAGYIKLHLDALPSIRFCAWSYIVVFVGAFASSFFFDWLAQKTSLPGFTQTVKEYTSLTTVAMAVFIFLAALKMKPIAFLSGKAGTKLVLFFSSSCLGVYLIHENLRIRLSLWNFSLPASLTSCSFCPFVVLVSCLSVFIFCALADKILWEFSCQKLVCFMTQKLSKVKLVK